MACPMEEDGTISPYNKITLLPKPGTISAKNKHHALELFKLASIALVETNLTSSNVRKATRRGKILVNRDDLR